MIENKNQDMMNDYELSDRQWEEEMQVEAPEETLQNIMSFVRCCQTVEAGGMRMRLFLN
jgi:hypothetical protein